MRFDLLIVNARRSISGQIKYMLAIAGFTSIPRQQWASLWFEQTFNKANSCINIYWRTIPSSTSPSLATFLLSGPVRLEALTEAASCCLCWRAQQAGRGAFKYLTFQNRFIEGIWYFYCIIKLWQNIKSLPLKYPALTIKSALLRATHLDRGAISSAQPNWAH